jgi:iron complex outermembrane receptor protein
MSNSASRRRAPSRSARFAIAGAWVAVGASTAWAQVAPTTDPDHAKAVDEVVVTGRANFLSADTSGTTGLPIQIEKVPQSISLVSAEFIKAADLKTIGDVAQYTPGALYLGVPEGIGAVVKLRGFSAGAAVDGLQVQEYYDPDYATIDRLEVVKGPSSVIYGVASPGGLVNRVTKGAGPNTPSYVSAQGGSWNDYRFEGQFAHALDKDGNIRGIAVLVADGGDSFQDSIRHTGYVAYAGVNADFTPDLSGFIHGGWEYHKRTAFDGLPSEADGSPAPLPRSFFIGDPNDQLTTRAYYADANMSWRATSDLEFGLKAIYENSNTRGTAPYSFGLDSAGDLGVALQIYSPYVDEDYGVEGSALYRLDRLGLKNSFITVSSLYQVESVDDNEETALFNGNYYGVANIFSGEAAITQVLRSAAIQPGGNTSNIVNTRTWTLTTQSIIQPVDHLSILLGASYSTPHIDNNTTGVTQNFSPAGNFSYRAGATYEFLAGANLYASYSQSFSPQAYIDVNGDVLPPLTGEQYEGGVKWRTLGDKLLLTVAGYDIYQNNQAEFDEQLGGFDRYKAIGEVEHTGFEIEALGRITKNIQVNAGYTYLDPTIKKDLDPTIVGKTDIFLPHDTASLFASYSILEGRLNGLTLGAGLRYVGSENTSFDGSTGPLKGYIVADASLAYDYKTWTAQINLKNLFDKTYYINEYGTLFYGNTVGAPRSVQFTLRRRF